MVGLCLRISAQLMTLVCSCYSVDHYLSLGEQKTWHSPGLGPVSRHPIQHLREYSPKLTSRHPYAPPTSNTFQDHHDCVQTRILESELHH
ncbi:hypothetical protein HOY82DRAFT_214703 [Tuber indicum]|nr:hypothetical protein HOY82DRAFT_214703 [Tuber indicum]